MHVRNLTGDSCPDALRPAEIMEQLRRLDGMT